MAKDENHVTLRRSLEQTRNCIQEALSVVENSEDSSMALQDVEHALELIKGVVVPALRERIAIRSTR
jgi:hypothetical protein